MQPASGVSRCLQLTVAYMDEICSLLPLSGASVWDVHVCDGLFGLFMIGIGRVSRWLKQRELVECEL